MKRKIISLPHFTRRLKRLAKKFRSLSDELKAFEKSVEQNPKQGKDLGAGLYKIRLASKSKGTGKSGGFRVVTYYVEQIGDEQTVYLVTIYDKSEEESIDKDDLLAIVHQALIDPDEQIEPELD
jgi:hypothetical protein